MVHFPMSFAAGSVGLVAANAGSPDLRIVVDMSEPMLAQDELGLRKRAMEYLIQATPDQGKAGIWSFADYVRIVAKHQSSGGLWKQVASIKASSLVSDGVKADLPGGLQAALKGLSSSSQAHIVLLSNGSIRTGEGATADARARKSLLAQWAEQSRSGHVKVHTLGVGQLSNDHVDLLRQLAHLSGGQFFAVSDGAALEQALTTLNSLINHGPQTRLDATGRFNVAPGAQRLTFTWMDASANTASPKIEQPDGEIFSRSTSVPSGRWIVGTEFEIVTINSPQPGWWQVAGPSPDSLSVFGEIELDVEGVASTVVPSDENTAKIRLLTADGPITNLDFLALLDVRAWVVAAQERQPLPVDVEGDAYLAHFVDLHNGPHTLEVEVTAPTFTRHFQIPFMVANPLLVEVRNSVSEGSLAWLQFSHPMVDYAGLKVSGIIRKPPQVATIVPAERMPGGLWKIPIGSRTGVIELAFTVTGNYLNGDGVYVKTNVHAASLPLAEGEDLVLRYDGHGRLLQTPVARVDEEPPLDGAFNPASGNVAASMPEPGDGENSLAPLQAEPLEEDKLPLLPLWFVALIGLLNLGIGGLIWWFNKPQALPFTPIDVAEPA